MFSGGSKREHGLNMGYMDLSKLNNFYLPRNFQKTYGFLMIQRKQKLTDRTSKQFADEELFCSQKCLPFQIYFYKSLFPMPWQYRRKNVVPTLTTQQSLLRCDNEIVSSPFHQSFENFAYCNLIVFRKKSDNTHFP